MNSKAIWHSGLIVLILAAVLAPSQAAAKGFYVKAELGRSEYSDDINMDTEVIQLDGTAASFRLAVGYDLSRYFSAEGGYIDFGELDFGEINSGALSGSASARADGLEVSLVGKVPVGDRLSLTGRAGFLWWDAEVQISDMIGTESNGDLLVGIGGEFSATDRIALTAGWTRYKLEDDDIDYLSVGLRFRFGKNN